MKKRNYEKPSMKVVVLNKQPQLLAGSYTSTGGFGGYSSDTPVEYGPSYNNMD